MADTPARYFLRKNQPVHLLKKFNTFIPGSPLNLKPCLKNICFAYAIKICPYVIPHDTGHRIEIPVDTQGYIM
ncbi:MAG: hypothetical protein L0958_00640 [Candidatus Mariimomonas ferrooxydans]